MILGHQILRLKKRSWKSGNENLTIVNLTFVRVIVRSLRRNLERKAAVDLQNGLEMR